ncbi:hypothetical protein DFH08DRAFT_892223 [Mycena albidolilacea]|uniref:CFEM domain-containing protein n=1 Tax=Mycena albidolilacea TaxID=1033008 RepID=A0AAD7EEN4_9AGAR|nr:hypothetical protein DFH08DRAFT_892223 [Mycena albidolilacea]
MASATAALGPCALTCITDAAAATECNILGNLTCVCTNPDFQFKSMSCIQSECQAAELGAAIGAQQQQCGGAGSSTTLSVTGTPSATNPFLPSNSASDISGSPSSSQSGTTGGAVPLWSGNGLILAILVAVFGGVVGAAIV